MMLSHPVYGTPLPTGWEVMSIDQVKSSEKSSCVAGPFGSNIASKFFVPDGVPIIRGSNLTDDLTQFVSESFVFVSTERALTYRAQHVRAGDLVFTCWGTIGQVGLIPDHGPYPEYIISNKQLKLRPDTSRADPRFLFYYFASPAMVEHIRQRAIGSAVPGINLGILKSLPVTLPPLPIQRKIVALLSAYDDLIENNNRRIKVLEEMAQRLYREWFVDFRYPGHSNARLVDSELGPIPEGWLVRPLEDVAEVNRGLSWSRDDEIDSGGLPIITIPNVQTRLQLGGMTRLANVSASDIEKYSLAHGDTVLVGSNGNPERVGHAVWIPRGADILFASFLMRVRSDPSQIGAAMVHMQLKDPRLTGAWRSSAIGSTSLRNIRLSTLRASPLLIPSAAVSARAEAIVRELLDMQDTLDRASAILRATRDSLLPRLICGAVDMTDLEIVVPEAAA